MSICETKVQTPEEDSVWIASFDIGVHNFAFYVEEIPVSPLEQLDNIPKKARYESDGTPTHTFNDLLSTVCSNGKRILLDNVDLAPGKKCKNAAQLNTTILLEMSRVLDSHKDVWDHCTAFMLEQQMQFGAAHNTLAIKLGQHCYSYFLFQYGASKVTMEIPSYRKTRVLGAPKTNNYSARKRWAIQYATSLLLDRKDYETVALIQRRLKQDDLADVIVQLQAVKYMVFVDKNIVL